MSGASAVQKPSEVTIGDSTKTIPPITGRKYIRLGRLVSKIGKSTPEILEAWGDFRADYERKHRIELDRAQALMRYGPIPAMREVPGEAEGTVIAEPLLDDNGDPVMLPGPLEHLTEADWAASDNMLRLPSTPSLPEQFAAIFPLAFDAAEDYLTQIFGLLLVGNDDLNKAAREGGTEAVDKLLNEKGNEVLDVASLDQMMELLVIAGERIDDQRTRAQERLGERVGKVLNLIGLGSLIGSSSDSPTDQSSKSTPISSTDSPAPTDGAPTSHSTESSSDSSQSLATA